MDRPHQTTFSPPPAGADPATPAAGPLAVSQTPPGENAKPQAASAEAVLSDPFDPETVDQIIRFLCNLQDRSSIVWACLTKLALAPEQVDTALEAARAKLTRAADFHRTHELGRAVTRLNELYSRAVAMQDTKTAISAQKELNRLLALYPAGPGTGDREPGTAGEEAQTAAAGTRPRDLAAQDLFDACDAHLEPLALSDDPADQYPDLIRLAGAEIVRLRQAARPRRKPKSPLGGVPKRTKIENRRSNIDQGAPARTQTAGGVAQAAQGPGHEQPTIPDAPAAADAGGNPV